MGAETLDRPAMTRAVKSLDDHHLIENQYKA